MRVLSAAAIVAGLLLLTACQPTHQSGDAAPAGSGYPQPDTSTSVAASPSPTVASPTGAASTTTAGGTHTSNPTVLGPNGFGALKLGMSRRQAEATGLVSDVDPKADSGCQTTALRAGSPVSGTVYFDGASGVVAIDARGGGVKTPEGLHVGSPGSDVSRIYPKWRSLTDPGANDGRGYVLAPNSNDKAEYNISIGNAKVTQVMLQTHPHHCYE